MLNPNHLTGFSPLRALAVVLAVASLVACSGGGGGGSNFGPRVDQEAGGVWVGTITSDSAAGPSTLSGVVTETGEVQFTSPDGAIVYTGTIQVRGDEITGTLNGVNFAGIIAGALPAGAIDIEGTVTSQGTITGSYAGADSGTFSLSYSDTYERVADVGKLASDWTSIGNPLVFKSGIGGEADILNLIVNDDGTFQGADSAACSYIGAFAVGDPAVNVYDVQLDIADCGGLNGSYTGLASLTDAEGENNTLALSASNMNVAVAFTVDRLSSRSAAGLWSGNLTSDMDLVPVPVFAIISAVDNARFIDLNGAQLAGTADVSGNFFDSTFDAFVSEGDLFPDGTTFGSVDLTGTVDTRTSLLLSYNGVGDTGLIDVSYDPAYENGSSLATVQGDWAFDDGAGFSVDVSVDGAGAVTGSDSDGCTYTGTVAIIDTNFNAYDVGLSASGCARAGDYTGLAAVLDNFAPEDSLIVAVSNSQLEQALSIGLERVAP